MKRKNTKRFIKGALTLITALTLTLGIGFSVAAEDEYVGENPIEATFNGENSHEMEASNKNTDGTYTNGGESGDISQNNGENLTPGEDYEANVFEEIYSLIESNADKIFSVLAFVGTLAVGVGYKSGFLPLLRDALSKLKDAIDGVKADGESTKELTGGKLTEIGSAVENIENELRDMKWQYESYEEICRDRESMRLILQGQIDMLYSIFMTSALPQYQKDEVGEKILEMKEVLKKHESSKKN